MPVDNLIARLRPQLAHIPGGAIFLQAAQDMRVGGASEQRAVSIHDAGRQSRRSDEVRSADSRCATQTIPIHCRREQRSAEPRTAGHGRHTTAPPRRASASQPQLIDTTLYDAFGQRQVSTMYTSLNQYHVVMEAAPEFWQNPEFLKQVYVKSPNGGVVPLPAFSDLLAGRRAALP